MDLTGVELAYVSNSYFVTDNGDPVVNVVLAGAMPAGAEPRVAAPDEVAGIVWLALAEAESDPDCPPWTVRSLRRAAMLMTTNWRIRPELRAAAYAVCVVDEKLPQATPRHYRPRRIRPIARCD